MSVHIISDSTCDLSPDLVEEYGINILPLHVLLGEDDRLDGKTVTPDELFEWSDKNGLTPKTAAPSPDEAIQLMKQVLNEDPEAEMVCFSISAALSSSNNAMRFAAEELEIEDRVYVVDTKSLSCGVGVIAMYASVLASQGKSAKEISDLCTKLIPKVRVDFVVDTLTYLHRGGRCSGLAAFMGTTLKLHPKIEMTDGTLHPGKKYRGNMTKVMKDYTDDIDENLRKANRSVIFLVNSGCDQDFLDKAYEHLKSVNDFERIYIQRAGSVISSHCGPGAFGIMYIEGE